MILSNFQNVKTQRAWEAEGDICLETHESSVCVLPADSPADDGAPPVVAGYPRALPWVRVRVNDLKHI